MIYPGPPGEDGYICPNDLMMGRSSKAPPIGTFESSSLARKLQFTRSLVVQFWERWYTSYYQRLVKYHKWRTKFRNAKPGDIVLILDREAPKGKYTLAEILSVKTDADQVVRKVIVRYKLNKSGEGDEYTPVADKFVERSVRGLSLVLTAEERNSNLDCGNNPIENEEPFDIQQNVSENDCDNEKIEDIVSNDDHKVSKKVELLNAEASRVMKVPAVSSETGTEVAPTVTGRRRWKPQRYGN